MFVRGSIVVRINLEQQINNGYNSFHLKTIFFSVLFFFLTRRRPELLIQHKCFHCLTAFSFTMNNL